MIRAALVPFLLASALAGQQTWVVDVEGNGDFVFLVDAVNAAAPGDIVLVNYWSGLPANLDFTLSKGLTIVGQGIDRAEVSGHLVITAVPAGQQVVLRSLQFSAVTGAIARVSVVDCPGAVVFDDVVLDGAWNHLFAQPALIVSNSPRVHVGRCQLTGAPGLGATVASVTCTGTSIHGSTVVSGPGTTGVAVDAALSRLSLAGCVLVGGSNYNLGGFSAPGKSALVLTDSTATLAGGVLYGGLGFNGTAASAVVDAPSTLEFDAAVFFGTPSSGAGTTTQVETGVLSGGIPPPTIGTITLDAAPGAIGFVLLSLPGPEVATPFGSVWLAWIDSPLAFGVVPVASTLPPLAFLPRGFAVALQGVVLFGGELRLSTPLMTTMP